MVTRIGSKYEARLIKDEYSWFMQRDAAGTGLDEWPHVRRVLESRACRFTLQHVQNFCWTVERLAKIVRRSWTAAHAKPAARPSEPVNPLAVVSGRRILFDLTNTHRRGPQGGISRVGLMLARECASQANTIPVVLANGALHRLIGDTVGDPVDIIAGDIYFLIDCFWDPLDEYLAFVRAQKPNGLLLATCFYDIIIALYPFVLPDHARNSFVKALPPILEASDIAISISQSSLDDLRHYAAREVPGADPVYAAFTLGCDFAKSDGLVDEGRLAIANQAPLFLSVGTIEPKKGYTVTLDAMDLLWTAGFECNLLIIGRYGWCSTAVAGRIKTHPRFGINLFWEEKANDAVLQDAYRRCYCFIQSSVGEGFGIPIVEAASYDLPIICSDIDVFQEIGGDGLIYFESENAEALAMRMREALAERPRAATITTPTWHESFVSVCDVLDRGATALVASGRHQGADKQEANRTATSA